MSRLLAAVQSEQTGVRRVHRSPLNLVRVTDELRPLHPLSCGIGSEYRISACVEYYASLAFDAEPGALNAIKREAHRAITEEVFGEFRPHLRAIHQALAIQDVGRAQELVRNLEAAMFESDLDADS